MFRCSGDAQAGRAADAVGRVLADRAPRSTGRGRGHEAAAPLPGRPATCARLPVQPQGAAANCHASTSARVCERARRCEHRRHRSGRRGVRARLCDDDVRRKLVEPPVGRPDSVGLCPERAEAVAQARRKEPADHPHYGGQSPPTSGPVAGLAPLHLHWDWAHPCHSCTGTELTPPTSAPGLGPGRAPAPDR